MNAMDGNEERQLRELLTNLRLEHRDLDTQIEGLEALGTVDQLMIKRLKKRKLQIKDKISTLEDRLFPDIIA
jgi:hypothetical protein